MIVAAAAGAGAMAGAGPADSAPAEGPAWELWVMVALCPIVLGWLWRADVIRPGSPARHRTRDLAGSPWLVWWAAGVAMIFAHAAGGALGLLILGVPQDAAPDSEGVVLSQVIGAALGAAFGFYMLWWVGELAGRARAGLSIRPRMKDGVHGALALLVSWPIIVVIGFVSAATAEWITGRPPPLLAHDALHLIKDDPRSARAIAMIFAAVILAPLTEEVLFRVLVQSGFLRLFGRVWPSVLATSVVFAAVHIDSVGESRHALVTLFALGAALGLAYERTGRVWVPIFMHALFNAANIAFTLAI